MRYDVPSVAGSGKYLDCRALHPPDQDRAFSADHFGPDIGGFSKAIRSRGFGTDYRYRSKTSGDLDGSYLAVDFVKLAEGLGARTVRARTREDVEKALEDMRTHERTSVVVMEVDKEARVPGYESWWDVPIAEVSDMGSTRQARREYEKTLKKERHYQMAASRGLAEE